VSLNWKEINLILEELELEGSRIQKAIQSVFDVLALSLYGKRGALTLLISLSPGACRLHETFAATPKSVKPLRFAQFLNSRIVNGRIEEALQLGDNRIVRMKLRRGDETCFLYIRLWSNAANVIVTDEGGTVLDAMKRLPKRGEISGGSFTPEKDLLSGGSEKTKTYEIRELPGEGSFNRRVDSWYANQGGALSLDSLREQARRHYEGSIGRLKASLEALREKEADFASADRLREYGSLILANLGSIGLESKDLQSRKEGDQWLETENFYSPGSPDEGSPHGNFPKGNGIIRIKLGRGKTPVETAEDYFERYRKAKSGLEEVRAEIESEGREIRLMEETLEKLLSETNPLILHKLLRAKGRTALPGKAGAERKAVEKRKAGDRRPGLCFLRKDWIIIVGRDAGENDALLRKYVKGNDLWLHSRDYPGSYVFIKQRAGKTVPLDILLDAGNLAIFYSKGRNSGEGDLFYTPVKYLRRAKNGPRGLVIPTQEKNLHVKVEAERLRELEACRM
jgi:predicted ribosome quality control (RQC) complex YloA/Tae2 family protein